MMKTAKLKIKMTKNAVKVLQLKKLRTKGVGTNNVEHFAKREAGDGKRSRRRRKRTVQALMKFKILDAQEEEKEVKELYVKRITKLERRWGHHTNVMRKFKEVMQSEVRRTWEERMEKMKKNINFLERKWMRKRQDLDDKRPKTWRGIRYGDTELEQKLEEEGREKPATTPAIYGGAEFSPEAIEVHKLPANFCTFEAVTEDKMKVATDVTITQAKWELNDRKQRKEDAAMDGEEGEGKWTEEYENRRQIEKDILISPSVLDFSNRRVTDIPTCRRLHPPRPLSDHQMIVLNNIKTRIVEVTKLYLKKCGMKGFPKTKNTNER